MKGITHNIRGWTTGFSAPGFKQILLFGNNEVMEGNQMYNGNQPVNATDHADPVNTEGSTDFKDGRLAAEGIVEYAYNGVGALTSDMNKNITMIDYDNLNHIRRMTFANREIQVATIDTTLLHPIVSPVTTFNYTEYTYTPDGDKTRVVYSVNRSLPFIRPANNWWQAKPLFAYIRDTTEYIGPFVLKNGTLDKVLFNGGYVTFEKADTSEQTFHYYSTDHQGNVRAVYDEKGDIEQSIAYDPFGVIIPDLSTGTDIQPYLYNGKELDRVHGLNWYDYGARMYDVTLGRWTTVDPLCEKYYHVSPYAYCGNNPIGFVDIKGEDVLIWYNDAKGNERAFRFNGTQNKCPDNQFVKDFIHAYNYMKYTGGGESLREAVTNPKYEINVWNALWYEPEDQDTWVSLITGEVAVIWESRRGLKTTDGGRQSAATRLDHEFNHVLSWFNNAHNHRQRQNTPDKTYYNKEERRVITGGEATTAKANGESIRKNHRGKVYDTINPISVTSLEEFNKKKHK